MTFLAKAVLRSARYKLSDTDSQRFTVARLLELLNNALKDLSLKTNLLRKTIFVGISDQVVDYDLSSFAFRIHRVEYLDEKVELKSFAEMDAKDKSWQLRRGDKPLAIVLDEQKQANFKLYPIISNAENTHVNYTSFFGIVTYITYSDILPVLAEGYGDMSDLGPAAYLKVYYTGKHVDITDVNTELEMDQMCLEPLGHYVAGHALRDNADTQNRNMGNENLQFYYKLVDEHSAEKAQNHNRMERKSPYNPSGG